MTNAVDLACSCGKCANCPIHNRSVCSAATAEAMAQLNRISHIRSFARGTVIQAQGDVSDIVGNIVEGVVKLSSASASGDDHIVGLLFPSDFFGRLFSEESQFSYEAVTDVTLCAMNRPGFERFLADHPAVEHEMLKAKLDELDAVREWAAITMVTPRCSGWQHCSTCSRDARETSIGKAVMHRHRSCISRQPQGYRRLSRYDTRDAQPQHTDPGTGKGDPDHQRQAFRTGLTPTRSSATRAKPGKISTGSHLTKRHGLNVARFCALAVKHEQGRSRH
jgi:CRP-like cAMP-binding protein